MKKVNPKHIQTYQDRNDATMATVSGFVNAKGALKRGSRKIESCKCQASLRFSLL